MKKNNPIDLSVNLNNKLILKNPFILGSFDALDCFEGLELAYKVSNGNFGAIVAKTTTVKKRIGYKEPKVANFGDGFLVASGLKNPGVKAMSQEIRKFKKHYPDQVIFGSITSLDPSNIIKEINYLALTMVSSGIDGLELNLSCPHSNRREKFKTSVVAQDPIAVKRVISGLKRFLELNNYNLPIIPKLTGWNCNLEKVSLAAEEGGADALLISNVFPGTGFYTGLKKIKNNFEYKIGEHLIGNVKGGYTGKALHSAVLLMIDSVRRFVKIPIIATGGCASDIDSVIQTFFAGAIGIEAVTPFYFEKNNLSYRSNLKRVSTYVKELSDYMKKNKFKKINEFYGFKQQK